MQSNQSETVAFFLLSTTVACFLIGLAALYFRPLYQVLEMLPLYQILPTEEIAKQYSYDNRAIFWTKQVGC